MYTKEINHYIGNMCCIKLFYRCRLQTNNPCSKNEKSRIKSLLIIVFLSSSSSCQTELLPKWFMIISKYCGCALRNYFKTKVNFGSFSSLFCFLISPQFCLVSHDNVFPRTKKKNNCSKTDSIYAYSISNRFRGLENLS